MRAIDVRRTIVVDVKIDGYIGGVCIEARRLNARDGAPCRQPVDVLGYIDPVSAGIRRVPELAVVRSCPDQPLLLGRRGNRINDFAVELSKVVADQPS